MNQERDQHRKNQPMYRRQIFRMPGARTGKALTPSPWGRTQGPGGQSTRGRWGRTWGGTPRTWRRPPGPAPGPESQHCPRTLLRDLWNLKRSSWGSVEVWGVKWSHTVLNRENNIYFAYVGKGILYKVTKICAQFVCCFFAGTRTRTQWQRHPEEVLSPARIWPQTTWTSW